MQASLFSQIVQGNALQGALVGKLPSLPPVHMLLDPAKGTVQQFVQVPPLGLVPDRIKGYHGASST